MSLGLLGICAGVLLASLAGGMLPLATVLTHTRLQMYLSVSAGSMLGAAFLHMLPEAVERGGPSVLTWAALGLLGLFFLERFFAFHHHEAPDDPSEPCPTHPHTHAHSHVGHSAGVVTPGAVGAGGKAKAADLHWGAAAFGLAVHSLVGGVALASAWAIGGAAAWGAAVATLVHKPADALTLVSLMLRAGLPKPFVHAVNFGFSLMIPLGAVLFVLGAGSLGPAAQAVLTSRALAFSAGTFLCIALSDLLPELQFHDHDRFKLSAALLAGFGLMGIAEIGAHS